MSKLGQANLDNKIISTLPIFLGTLEQLIRLRNYHSRSYGKFVKGRKLRKITGPPGLIELLLLWTFTRCGVKLLYSDMGFLPTHERDQD